MNLTSTEVRDLLRLDDTQLVVAYLLDGFSLESRTGRKSAAPAHQS